MEFLVRILVRLVESISEWLVDRFPRRHRSICIWLFEIGLTLILPFLYLGWSGRLSDEDIDPNVRLFSVLGLCVGVILTILAVGMLDAMRRSAKPRRDEKDLIWIREEPAATDLPVKDPKAAEEAKANHES